MTLQSMTGFARREGTSGRHRWVWEIRSVNGKGLDVRLRLPQALEHLEAEIRKRFAGKFSRGNMQANLSLSATENRFEAVVNQSALASVLGLRSQLADVLDPAPLKLDTLLSIKGIVEFRENEEDAEAIKAREVDVLDGLNGALEDLKAMRAQEGSALRSVLGAHLEAVAGLARAIERDPSRSPAEIRNRLMSQIAVILDGPVGLDRERLLAEVALLATKADLKEEIDRLQTHVEASRLLLQTGGPVGRKLDFLAQEFNREANTICSKSNAAPVTAAGIELKVVIDQFREQVQNLE